MKNITTDDVTRQQIANLREAAASAFRDADGEFPGSYYRKAHRARARRYLAKAEKLAAGLRQAEHDAAGPEHREWCAGPGTHREVTA